MIKRVFLRAIVGIALLITPLLLMAAVPPVQQQDGISYVSGGVGIDEREALEEISGNFNLRLTFAVRAGNYLADVNVRILDRAGNPVLDATSRGPWFFANLPSGAYMVQVSSFDQNYQRSVQVRRTEQTRVVFHFRWP